MPATARADWLKLQMFEGCVTYWWRHLRHDSALQTSPKQDWILLLWLQKLNEVSWTESISMYFLGDAFLRDTLAMRQLLWIASR